MALPEAAPSWEAADSAFEFDLPRPQHIQRGWERAPKSPHRAHQKGRKLWKRPGPRALGGKDYPSAEHNCDEERRVLGELSNNTPRAVKKLRLKDQDVAREAKGTKGSRYLATLKDISQSTPKRKQTNTRELDFPRAQLREHGNSDVEPFDVNSSHNQLIEDTGSAPSSPQTNTRGLHIPRAQLRGQGTPDVEPSDTSNSHNQLITDTVRTSSSPAPLEVRNTSSPPSSATEEAPIGVQEAEVRDKTWGSGESFPAEDVLEEAQPAGAEAGMTPGVDTGEEPVQEPASPSLDGFLLPKKSEVAANDQHLSDTPKANARVIQTSNVLDEVTQDLPEEEVQIVSTNHSPANRVDLPPPLRIFPLDGLTPRAHQIRDIFGPGSPQIGTTLLRRESLRKKDSPRKGPGRPKGSSPKKQLKKRDTLQEREILQKFEESDAENKKDLEQPGTPAIPFTSSVILLPDIQPDFSNNATIESIENDVNDQQVINDVNEAILETKDLHRAVEALEASEEAHRSTTTTEHTDTGSDDSANQQAYEAIAQAEIDEAQAAITAVCEKADLAVRKTRSGARFSDDTSMLKDFLNRAQARKAAQGGGFSPKVPKSLQQSPKRSPQKNNAIRPASRSSPRKARVLTPRQTKYQKGSPSGKVSLLLAKSEDGEDDDGHDDETNGEETKSVDPGSCRRSTRTRLPAPVKNPPGAPSFIPVRRTDGTDPVVLQKTQAQELAITTRANTRRNKGQSRPPALALQDIPMDDAESTTCSRQRAANGKAVVWAEQLTSFQEWQEGTTEESEEQLPKVKRMRGLGNSTGTPVAKRTAGITGASNGTPAPKRRGKMA